MKTKRIVMLLFVFSFSAWCSTVCRGGNVKITAAYQVKSSGRYWKEGSKEINLAKKTYPDLPVLVYVYFKNEGKEPVWVKDIAWDGLNIEKRQADYSLIWWRSLPATLQPGQEAEIAVCLRKALEKATEFTINFSDGSKEVAAIQPKDPAFRIQTLNFGKDFRNIYLYLERSDFSSAIPEKVYLDGKEITSGVRWLSDGYVKDLRVCIVNLRSALKKGSLHTFRVTSADGGAACAAAMRAFNDIAAFGTYGGGNYERFAQNGLGLSFSFRSVGKSGLERAKKYGIKCAMHAINRKGELPEDTIGHPGIYSYLLLDEPDVHDYSAEPNRPMHLRLGTLAPKMIKDHASCLKLDPVIPVMQTIDNTFNPGNYFVYAPIADIANPDFYPITCGTSISELFKKALTCKMAAAPKPLRFVYQGCGERAGFSGSAWVSGKVLKEKGYENFIDKERSRGFNRDPVPAEIRIQMLYAIAAGAKGLTSYTDSSEAGGDIVYYGTDVLEENWQAVGRTSRALSMVSPMIEISHPFDWAKSSNLVMIRTLVCGEKAALVVVVNENYTCDGLGFFQEPEKNVEIVFSDLPWFKPMKVVKVDDGKFTPIESKRNLKELVWQEKELKDGEVYLLVEKAETIKLVPIVRTSTKQP